ncbi:MAG: hypothetical protein IJ607_11500 [Bacteroidaceae bacterium]|nr:hypothetical protein [Bacteroidaceae bacterium]
MRLSSVKTGFCAKQEMLSSVKTGFCAKQARFTSVQAGFEGGEGKEKGGDIWRFDKILLILQEDEKGKWKVNSGVTRWKKNWHNRIQKKQSNIVYNTLNNLQS